MWEAIIGGVASLVSGLIATVVSRKNQKESNQIVDDNNSYTMEQNNLTREREDNAYQRAVEDAKKAGLSAFSVTGGADSSQAIPLSNEKANVNMQHSSNIQSAMRDLANTPSAMMNIMKTSAERDKLLADKKAVDNENTRAWELHNLQLEHLGLDNAYTKQKMIDEHLTSMIDNEYQRVLTNTTLSENDRKEAQAYLDRVRSQIENESMQLELKRLKETSYNPTYSDARKSAYLGELGAQTDAGASSRARTEAQVIANRKANSTFNYDVSIQKTQAHMLQIQLANMPAKNRAELVNSWVNALKNGVEATYSGIKITKEIVRMIRLGGIK